MAVVGTVDVITTALWPQGDIRDPLGTWGFRTSLTGTGDGGGMKVTARAAAGQSAAYVYTLYHAIIVQTVGTPNSGNLKIRILTNWPNIDRQAGVQAYASARLISLGGDAAFTAPFEMPLNNIMVTPLERFLLIFDPRPSNLVMDMVEMEFAENVSADVLSFEGYGYYWDRSVLQAPGGLRHPGSG